MNEESVFPRENTWWVGLGFGEKEDGALHMVEQCDVGAGRYRASACLVHSSLVTLSLDRAGRKLEQNCPSVSIARIL